MADHVFVSYERTDAGYTEQLAKCLDSAGVPVWFDSEVTRGSRWAALIREKIDTCAAFVVVMTPEAEASEWVEREINRANFCNKPVFPILLRGQPFFMLNEKQYEDATFGRLPPSAAFVAELRKRVGPGPGGDDPGGDAPAASTSNLDSDDDAAFQIMRHIYSRATSGPTTRRVLDFLRKVERLGTRLEIGKSARTRDGRSDYVMVRDAGPALYGAVVYLKPDTGGLTLRLRPADVADIIDPRVRPREVRSSAKYAINCPLNDDAAVELAVQLTERALAKVRELAASQAPGSAD